MKVMRARTLQWRANWKMRRANKLKRQSEALAAKSARLMAEVRADWAQPGVDRRRVVR